MKLSPAPYRLLLLAGWLTLGATVTLSGTAMLSAEEWIRFRGPNGSAVSDAKGIPTTWSETANLKWKTSLPGAGSSSPIVVGDRAYVTCYSGYGADRDGSGQMSDLKRHLVCVNLADGKIVWDKSVEAHQPEDRYGGFLREHGYATSTPTSDGKHIYVFFGKSGVFAFDLNGNQVWKTSVGTGSGKNGWGSGASPILHGNLVIVNAGAESRTLVALDKATGKEAWKSPADNLYDSWSTPALVDLPDGKKELVINAPYEIWGFNPDTGAFLWYAEGVADETICGSVVTRDGVVYALGGRGGSAVAVKAGGKDDASKTHTVWKGRASAYVPSPVLAGDRIINVSERGVVDCLNAKTGEKFFSQRLPDAGGIYASPAVIGGKVYIVTRRKGTIVMELEGEGKVIAKNTFDDDTDFNACPTVAGDTLLLRSNRYLYAVSAAK